MSNTNTNIDFTTLNPLINEFIEVYKRNLQPKKASGSLINQTKGKIKVNGKWLYVVLTLPEHWKYVEYGRRPGKFPPIDAIKGWIKVKPVVPDARTGKVPSEDQLAFLIARKISREGTPARHALNKAVYTDATEAIIQQIKDEIVVQLRQTALSDI